MTDTLFEDDKRKPEDLALALYQAYPLHRARGAAIRAILKALKTVDYDTLMAAVVRYAESSEVHVHIAAGNHRFIPRCATWFNDKCWDDEIPETPAARRKRKRDEMDECFKRVAEMERSSVEVAIAKLKADNPTAWGSSDYLDTQVGTNDGKRLCVRICQLFNSEAGR